MILVVDASVAVKWFFRTRDEEANTEEALKLLQRVGVGDVEMLQPSHFIAEVAGVLTRESPDTAIRDLRDLLAIPYRVDDRPLVQYQAAEIAMALGVHVFDALYHAVALTTPGAILITADTKYFKKAASLGSILRLDAFHTLSW